MMIRTHILPCRVPKAEADALNCESGRIYTRALVEHYRVYRQTGHWLSPGGLEHLVDAYEQETPRLLHAHSVDAAQQGFVQACHTARACRALGLATRYPYRRKLWRTTIWKTSGIRRRGEPHVPAGSEATPGVPLMAAPVDEQTRATPEPRERVTLLLARARGQAPIPLELPERLQAGTVREVRLVWDRVARRYTWHLVIENGQPVPPAPGSGCMGVDLGEVHPAALCDGQTALVITARALRANQQYTQKRLAELRQRQDHLRKGSRRWRRLQRRKTRFLAQQKRRARDIEHKVSRAVVQHAVARQTGTLAVGDVRDIADGKRLSAESQQKLGVWAHGRVRQYITYKAEAEGITVVLVDERATTKTCPQCGQGHKPAGRTYRCPDCGFSAHRDVVGAANILSRHLRGAVGQIRPPPSCATKYRYPLETRGFALRAQAGKRSRPDRAQVARPAHGGSREAAPL